MVPSSWSFQFIHIHKKHRHIHLQCHQYTFKSLITACSKNKYKIYILRINLSSALSLSSLLFPPRHYFKNKEFFFIRLIHYYFFLTQFSICLDMKAKEITTANKWKLFLIFCASYFYLFGSLFLKEEGAVLLLWLAVQNS